MFGIGGTELFIIVLFVIIIFGPDKIPEMARTAGRAFRMFKKVQEDVEHVIRTEIYTPDILGNAADKPIAPVGLTSTDTAKKDDSADASAIWAAAASENDEEEGEEE